MGREEKIEVFITHVGKIEGNERQRAAEKNRGFLTHVEKSETNERRAFRRRKTAGKNRPYSYELRCTFTRCVLHVGSVF